VVAGQFSQPGIELVAKRIEESVTRRNDETASPYPLSLSIGSVTTDIELQRTLEELLSVADQAMYQEKRRKKRARS
jgi:GGDEF domain-containing protein